MGNTLHICNYAAPYRGNFISSLEYLAQDLEKKGAQQVYLFPARAASSGAMAWIEQLRANGRAVYLQRSSVLKNAALLREIFKKHDIQTVFTHFSDGKMDVSLALAKRKQHVIRFFHCVFDVSPQSPKLHLYRLLWRKNTLVGVGKAVTRGLEQCFSGWEIHTVENAIGFSRLDQTDPFTRREGTACFAMGYNFHVKGVDLALRAVEALRKCRDVTLYIPAASHLDELKAGIERVLGSVPDWVVILPAKENVGTYYRNADVFLAPSRSEGFCYAVPEAVYCGATVVASDIPALKELRIPDLYYFTAGNADSLAEVLARAIDEREGKQAQREKAREAVLREYSLPEWSARVLALYRS